MKRISQVGKARVVVPFRYRRSNSGGIDPFDLGLFSVASRLSKAGHHVRPVFFERPLPGEGYSNNAIKAVLQAVSEGPANLMAIGSYASTIYHDVNLIRAVKFEFPNIAVANGGWGTIVKPQVLEEHMPADFIVKGHERGALLRFTDRLGSLPISELLERGDLQELSKIIGPETMLRTPGGVIWNLFSQPIGPPSPKELILDWKLLAKMYKLYPDIIEQMTGIPFTLTFGCYNECLFCNERGRVVKGLLLDEALERLKPISEMIGSGDLPPSAGRIFIADADFLSWQRRNNRNFPASLEKFIATFEIDGPSVLGTVPGLLGASNDFLDALVKHGIQVDLGVENTGASALRDMRKPQTPRTVFKAVERAYNLGLKLHTVHILHPPRLTPTEYVQNVMDLLEWRLKYPNVISGKEDGEGQVRFLKYHGGNRDLMAFIQEHGLMPNLFIHEALPTEQSVQHGYLTKPDQEIFLAEILPRDPLVSSIIISTIFSDALKPKMDTTLGFATTFLIKSILGEIKFIRELSETGEREIEAVISKGALFKDSWAYALFDASRKIIEQPASSDNLSEKVDRLIARTNIGNLDALMKGWLSQYKLYAVDEEARSVRQAELGQAIQLVSDRTLALLGIVHRIWNQLNLGFDPRYGQALKFRSEFNRDFVPDDSFHRQRAQQENDALEYLLESHGRQLDGQAFTRAQALFELDFFSDYLRLIIVAHEMASRGYINKDHRLILATGNVTEGLNKDIF